MGLILFVLAATAAGAATPCTIHPKKGATKEELAAMAKVSQDDARKAALASLKDASKATVKEAELEAEKGCLVFSFDIAIERKSGIQEVQVDAGTGKVLSSKHESSEAEAAEKAKDKPTMKYIATEGAPKAIGPYSQAVVEGGFLFASGQLPLDPKTGEMVAGPIEQSAERIFDNLEAVLKEAGLTLADVVKTTVFLTKTEDFPAMNAVYGRRFGDHRPARSTVTAAGLPRNAPLEIDLVARVKP